ncbi:MAG TPA: HAD family hydrolase [Candidatus Saccharimonadales bacterium]|nr:HAD family hydrolase [Candidatus Saccharimonadales bacterium]
MKPIKHVWFDMEGTLTVHTPKWESAHNKLLLETYSEVTGKPVSDQLWREYCAIYVQQGTHSAAFRSLGLPSDFWQLRFAKLDEEKYYAPDERVYATLNKIRNVVPISLFSNAKPDRIARTLKVIEVDSGWFTHILSGDEVPERKPELHGFHRLIELSALDPGEILYVGDRVKADIDPAKSLGMQTALVWNSDVSADYSFENFANLKTLFIHSQ